MVLLSLPLLTESAILLATLVAVVFAYFKWAYLYWKRRNVPYLEPSFPFGNLPNPVTSNLSPGENGKLLYETAKARGLKNCGLFMVSTPALMTLDLEILKHIMTKDFNYFVDRGVFVNEKDDPISAHLFSLGGEKWKNLRAKLTPTFTSGKMKHMFQTMADCGTLLEKYIEEDVADKQVVDIKDVLARFSTDIIGSCAFGVECNSFKEPNSAFRKYGKKTFELTTVELFKNAFSGSFPSLARKLHISPVRKDINEFFWKLVEDTIDYRLKNNVSRKDFLQMLIEIKSKDDKYTGDGNQLTLSEIVAQCFIFFAAGFETSSTTMSIALFEMATHPEIQDKVREEIRTVLARHDNKITYDAMNELVYMKQVIDETMRMYPPLPILTRKCVKDYKIPGEDIVIKKGTMVYISVMGQHYDKDYFENPEKFDPERFTDENKNKRHRYAHIPFGEGPRVCIGERFGVLQTKVGLTSILRNFKISLNEKTTLPLKLDKNSPFVLSALGGIWLEINRV